jgi:PhnB protein
VLTLDVVLANWSTVHMADRGRRALARGQDRANPVQDAASRLVETRAAKLRSVERGELAITRSTIHLTVDGADAASAWYGNALGARERNRITLLGGKLIHVELRFGDLAVMLADEFPDLNSFGPRHLGGTYGAIYLHVDDVDAMWERALRAGATVVRPLADAFWGEREGQVLDPFGHRWGLTQHVRDVSIAEMQELATAAFSERRGDS